jgi:hypothetical protein
LDQRLLEDPYFVSNCHRHTKHRVSRRLGYVKRVNEEKGLAVTYICIGASRWRVYPQSFSSKCHCAL